MCVGHAHVFTMLWDHLKKINKSHLLLQYSHASYFCAFFPTHTESHFESHPHSATLLVLVSSPQAVSNERVGLGQCPPVIHLSSLGLTQLRVYHVTEMTQWQLDCDQDISSVNLQMWEQKNTVFAGQADYTVFCFLRGFGFAAFCTFMK